MKKNSFIVILVLVCVTLTGILTYGGLTAFSYATTIDDYYAMEDAKTVTVNQSEIFTNPLERIEYSVLAEVDYSDYKYVFLRDNIHFLSNTDAWSERMLEDLSNELYANKHGEEIDYLSSVILHEGLEGDYIGTQESLDETFLLPISLHGFFPTGRFRAHSTMGCITLYEAEVRTTVDDMAVVLSHEYGHHFTNYHFGITFSEDDKNIYYYKLRGEGNDKVRLSADTMDEYLDNHMWFLNEFAAEDYVYFLGSPKAHRIVTFYDTADKVRIYARGGESALELVDYSYVLSRNGSPHENVSMGLPSEIEGLEEYFYSFIDEEPPVHQQREPLGTLNISMQKRGSARHQFTWDQPYDEKDVVYTLLLYGQDDALHYMVKTRDGNEEGSASFGYYTYKITKGSWIYTYSFGWDVDTGEKMRARVSVVFPDGSVMLSDPYDFEY